MDGWVFNTFCREIPQWEISTFNICCPHGSSGAAPSKKNDRLYLHPSVCNGVPTELLRASKQIYNKALPVIYTKFSDLLENPEMAARIRSLTITTTVYNVLILCEIIQRRLPMLAELRLHIDTDPDDCEYGSLVLYESEIKLLALLVQHRSAPVVFIGLHAPFELPWTWHSRPEGLNEELVEWVKDAVVHLENEAAKAKKRVQFRIWQ
ncbi:hypothetical protein LTR85_000200 [Meristemomyces frigidus]|nr:hypothetical protein LTR85_000200 [Meristemomyces frigidus]